MQETIWQARKYRARLFPFRGALKPSFVSHHEACCSTRIPELAAQGISYPFIVLQSSMVYNQENNENIEKTDENLFKDHFYYEFICKQY